MTETSSPDPTTPAWYTAAMAVPYTDRTVSVGGVDIHYLVWGEPGSPGLVFVHGGAAHAHWWTHIAAQFARVYRIAAIDMSGHGDSDRPQPQGVCGLSRRSAYIWLSFSSALVAPSSL